jgi:hypothetical protein
MFKALETNRSLARELGDTYSRVRTAEQFLNYPRLVNWTVRAFADPTQKKGEVVGDVTRELATKLRLYRDLARLKTGKRVKGRSWDAWGASSRPTAEPADGPARSQPITAREPQRSDLLPEEGEINGTPKVKELAR